jgi:hypothetical protein
VGDPDERVLGGSRPRGTLIQLLDPAALMSSELAVILYPSVSMTAPMDAGDTGWAGRRPPSRSRPAESPAAEAGLDAVALGERAVERAVRARLGHRLTPAAWAERLRRDQLERTALIDAVVVPETMLFRDGSLV